MANRVLPKLRLAVLCQEVEYDDDLEVCRLIDPIHTLTAFSFPMYIREITFYAQLEDAVGRQSLRILVRNEDGYIVEQSEFGEWIPHPIENRIFPGELILSLKDFKIPRPGIYWFHLMCHHTSLNDPRPSDDTPFPAPFIRCLTGEL